MSSETETEGKFQLYVHTDNAAFDDQATELARILRLVADKIEQGEDYSMFRTIFDVNGNDVGRWALRRGDYDSYRGTP